MPPPVNVPQHQRAAVEELATLTEEAYQAIRESLDRTGPLAEPTALIEQASRAVASHSRLGGQVAGMVIGLRSLVDRSALGVSDVAEAVAEDAVGNKKWISKEASESLKRRLSELLQMKAVAISAKAFTLAVGDESPFADIRILSDIRPIFSGTDTDLEFSGSVIVHHMVIEIGSSADDQYCALSSADLLKLKRAVDRAIEKDKKLRNILRNGPIAPLEAERSTSEKES
jgi:hypothetical protein